MVLKVEQDLKGPAKFGICPGNKIAGAKRRRGQWPEVLSRAVEKAPGCVALSWLVPPPGDTHFGCQDLRLAPGFRWLNVGLTLVGY